MTPFLNQNGIRTFGHNSGTRSTSVLDQPVRNRAEPRFKSANRHIRLIVGAQESSFVLHNVSSNGAAGVSDQALQTDQRVRLIFEGREEVLGIVRWVREQMIGIQFVNPLPAHLVQGKGSLAMPPREPRYKIARSATIQGDFPICGAIIRNVSTRGLLLETHQPLRIGQDVQVMCGKMLPMIGQIRWINGIQAGMMLTLPIALDDFEQATADATI